jgi:hypothetical protein
MQARHRSDRLWTAGAVLAGLVLSVALVVRGQVKNDQLNLLVRGWLLAFRHQWVPFGNPLSGGGAVPGGLTSLLTGLPLIAWPNYRAPVVLLLLSHIAAYWLLDRVVSHELGAEARLLLAVLYWLNPTRLYLSGFLWNPGYLFFFAALHLWTLRRSRATPRFGASLLLALTLGFAAQIHPAALILVAATVPLWWKGYFRLHWAGFLSGSLLVGLSLVPWWLATYPAGPGVPGMHATEWIDYLWRPPYSVFRAAANWIRYPSLAAGQSVLAFDFGPLLGAAGGQLSTLARLAADLVGWPSLLLPLWANRRMWRGARSALRAFYDGASGPAWLAGVVRWYGVALLAVAAISPISLQWFHLLVVHPYAVLVVVLALVPRLTSHRSAPRRLLAAWTLCSVLLGLAMVLASPLYRCGGAPSGRMDTLYPLRGDHPMLDDLGIRASCPPVVNEPGGWWMDIVPEPPSPPQPEEP